MLKMKLKSTKKNISIVKINRVHSSEETRCYFSCRKSWCFVSLLPIYPPYTIYTCWRHVCSMSVHIVPAAGIMPSASIVPRLLPIPHFQSVKVLPSFQKDFFLSFHFIFHIINKLFCRKSWCFGWGRERSHIAKISYINQKLNEKEIGFLVVTRYSYMEFFRRRSV